MPEKTQQCVGLTQLLPTLYKFRQNEEHERNGENSRWKENNSSPRHNKWPRKKLKNWSSDTDIRPKWDVVCGNIGPTVSSTTWINWFSWSICIYSTGMSSSINKELFQRGDIEDSRRSVGVTEMDDINDVSVIIIIIIIERKDLGGVI